jgi:tRNA modification GTPase
MFPSDTIAALSSSAFPAPRAIVRLSGSESFPIAEQLTSTLAYTSGAGRAQLALRGMRIPATLYRFCAPRSYTGEDVIEFHIPGNPLLTQILLEELLKNDARAAEPGEFTARAYFNGRLDLTQAEGVAAAVSAHSERESAAARRLLGGELTRRLEPIIELVAQTLALLEAGIDFSEEDVSFLPPKEAHSRIDRAAGQLRGLLAESVRFERLAHEPTVVLAGRPNAGKSTLLNALAGRQRAVVSPHAGTTRDVIWASVRLPRGNVRMSDIAGIDDTDAVDDIERQMRHQAMRAIESADVLVLVVDGTDARPPIAMPRRVDLVVRTKSDLPGVGEGEPRGTGGRENSTPFPFPSPGTPGEGQGGGAFVEYGSDSIAALQATPPPPQPSPGVPGEGERAGRAIGPLPLPVLRERAGVRVISNTHGNGLPNHPHPNPLPGYRERGPEKQVVSAHAGHELDSLRLAIDRLAFGGDSDSSSTLALNSRHVAAVERALDALSRARSSLNNLPADELIALELRETLDALGSIAGQVTPDDVLARIFSTFCIGK